MTEIKETLRILKARWPEVTLIISIFLSRPLVSKLLSSLVAKQLLNPDKFVFLYASISLLFVAILATLYSGFLRTVYLQANRRCSPLTLLRTGIYFLWRMVVLWALYSLPFLLVTMLSIRIIAGSVSTGGFPQIYFWINQLFFIAFSAILVKLILLLPALIIVLDCRTFESFKFLKHCRLWKAKELVILFYAHLFFRFLLRFPTRLRYILEIGMPIINCFIDLTIALMTVRFVASLDLVYYGSEKDLNSEDLLSSLPKD